jgi:WD40 repeat protein
MPAETFYEVMRRKPSLRGGLALALGVAVAFVAYQWPTSPRWVMVCDHAAWHLAFSRDSSKLAVLDREAGLNPRGQVLVLDVASGKLLHRLDHDSELYPSKVSFSPDGRSLGVVSTGSVTKWDLDAGRVASRYAHAGWLHDADHYYGRELLFSPEGRWLAHDAHEGRVYDVETGRVVQDYLERWPDRNPTAYGGCGAALLDGEVKTFDVLTGAGIGTFPLVVPPGTIGRLGLLFSSDGTHGLYFGDINQWVVFNAVTGRQLGLEVASDWVEHCCFSEDNRFVAVSSFDPPGSAWRVLPSWLLGSSRRVQVFDTTTGAQIGQSVRGGFTFCFAPDGKSLAMSDGGREVSLRDWPPPARWPRAVALAALTVGLVYGISGWWNRRRPEKAGRDQPES